MKSNIRFGIFCEDKAHRYFLENALPHLLSSFENAPNFEHETRFSDVIIALNNEFVIKNFIDRIDYGIQIHHLNLCFIGLDAENADHDALFSTMYAQLEENELTENAVIHIAVKAIEHWLWYLKAQKENLPLEPIEHISAKEMKRKVYGRGRIGNDAQKQLITDLVGNIDPVFLREHSPSFEHFYQQLSRYLNKNQLIINQSIE